MACSLPAPAPETHVDPLTQTALTGLWLRDTLRLTGEMRLNGGHRALTHVDAAPYVQQVGGRISLLTPAGVWWLGDETAPDETRRAEVIARLGLYMADRTVTLLTPREYAERGYGPLARCRVDPQVVPFPTDAELGIKDAALGGIFRAGENGGSPAALEAVQAWPAAVEEAREIMAAMRRAAAGPVITRRPAELVEAEMSTGL